LAQAPPMWSRLAQRSTRHVRAGSSGPLLRTPLYDFHVQKKGSMVDFAGWELPATYAGETLIQSVQRCRTQSAVFDVSHMGQLRITGPKRMQFLESVLVGAIGDLAVHRGQLSLITNDRGGIIDDTVLSRYEDHVYMVINAGCAGKDLAWLRGRLETFNAKEGAGACEILEIGGGVQTGLPQALLAVQGPQAEKHLQPLVDVDLSQLKFMEGREVKLGGAAGYVTRCGYTGEDGFEVSVAESFATELAERLLGEGSAMAALGARDALRLEAGLCLYGNDIDEDTTPVEAVLMWTIQKRRRAEGGFPGHAQIMEQFTAKDPTLRTRVGMLCSGAPARTGADVVADGAVVGKVSSGTFSPTLNRPISMAFIPKNKKDAKLETKVRNKTYAAEFTKMPFVPTKYKS